MSIGSSFGRLNFEGAFGNALSTQSKRTSTITSGSKRLPVSINEPTPDDEQFGNQNIEDEIMEKRPRRNSADDEFKEIFTENLLSQRDNQVLQNEVIKLQKAKLEAKMEIEIETSKVELEKKKLELETARKLAEIELKKQERLAELEIEKMQNN